MTLFIYVSSLAKVCHVMLCKNEFISLFTVSDDDEDNENGGDVEDTNNNETTQREEL